MIITKLQDQKTLSPDHFLRMKKIFEEKYNNHIKELIKNNQDELNMLLKDRPTINKNPERTVFKIE